MLRPIKRRVWTPLRHALARWQEDDGGLLAAAVAYYASLSVFPVLLLLVSALGLFLGGTATGRDVERRVIQTIGQRTSPELAQQVSEALSQVHRKAVVSGPLGVFGLLLASLVIFAQFERAFDRIWNVPRAGPPGIFATVKRIVLLRLRAFLMLMALSGFLFAVFIAGMTLSTIQRSAKGLLPFEESIWWFVQIGGSVALNTLALAAIYRWMPKVPVRWSEALWGGALAAVIWEAGRQVLAWLVIGDRFTTAYGVIGSFIALLLWVYYAIAVIFYGAEYVQVICQKCDEADAAPNAVPPRDTFAPGDRS